MSSPIAAKRRSLSDRAMVSLHQKASHGRRIGILADTVAPLVAARVPHGGGRMLDIGCGDLSLAAGIAAGLPGLDWRGTDIHDLPTDLADVEPWTRYTTFDGSHLPFGDDEFDVGLFADVLHHVPEDMVHDLVRDALRVCPALVVKDHFEYGPASRQSLKAMDVVGNRGYGISIPDRYFTKASFAALATTVGARVASLDVGLDLYGHLPVVRNVVRPKWQFVAVLTRG